MKKIFSFIALAFLSVSAFAQTCVETDVNLTGTASITFTRYEHKNLTGLFSVAAGKQVLFSQGNLQYQASTNTWRFAENQWDALQRDGGNETSSNRETQSKWIDMFGWGTSGWDSGATEYQPWTRSLTNTDYATQSTGGVVKVLNSGGGVQIDQGYLLIQNATLADIKSGTNAILNPIIPGTQYASTFYGLAKAAGDTTQASSSNAVGTYTDDAKTAIRSMIDAEKAVATVVVSGSSPTVNAIANTIYKCGEVISLSFTPCATGMCDIIFTSGSTPTVLTVPNTVKFPVWFNPTSIDTNVTYEINVLDGVYGVVTVWQ